MLLITTQRSLATCFTQISYCSRIVLAVSMLMFFSNNNASGYDDARKFDRETEYLLTDCCDTGDKPALVAVEYTAQTCSSSSNGQGAHGDKWSCQDNQTLTSTVYIIANTNKDPSSGDIWFSGLVTQGSTFLIDAANAGKTILGSNTYVHIYNSSQTTVLQSVRFHTSCSVPMTVGDQFGSLLVEGIRFENGTTCGVINIHTNGQICFAASDGNDKLYAVNPTTGASLAIGGFNVSEIEAISFGPNPSVLYATNGGVFGTINQSTGAFTTIATVGSGTGSAGTIALNDIDALTYYPPNGHMLAAHRRSGLDLIFFINRVTGKVVQNAFGANVDYKVISGTGVLNDVDDMAYDEASGLVYFTNNNGGANGKIGTINPNTGGVIIIATTTISDIEGLGFAPDGTLLGTASDKFYSINKTTGATTLINSFASGSDFEGIDCRAMCNPTTTPAPTYVTSCTNSSVQVESHVVELLGLTDYAFNFTNPSSIVRVVIEVFAKGNDRPSYINFTSNGQCWTTPGTQLKTNTTCPSGAGVNSSELRYNHEFTGSHSNITLSMPAGSEAEGATAYVFRNNNVDGSTYSAKFNSGAFLASDCKLETLVLPTSTGSRDVTVELVLYEISNDAREFSITVRAGGVTQTIVENSPNSGTALYEASITLNNVPGTTNSIEVEVESPQTNAQSLLFGAIVVKSGCNAVPTAVNDNTSTPMNTPVDVSFLSNDNFGGDGPAGGTTYASITSPPTNGTATILFNGPGTADDVIRYTPNFLFVGLDQVTYQICDSNGDCDDAVVTIDVTFVNSLPIASDDGLFAIDENSVNNSINVLANDFFGLDGPSSSAITVTSNPSHGTATVNNNGTPMDPTDDTIIYTPATDYKGPDQFQYQICDSNGDCDQAIVKLKVYPEGCNAIPFPIFIGPVLESGNAGQVNAVYRYSNVTENLDALVQILASSNAQLINIDEPTLGDPANFQPQVGLMTTGIGQTGYMDFQITLVNAGTSIPANQPSLAASAVDIDGDNVGTRESAGFTDFVSYTLESPTNLIVTTESPFTMFQANNVINVPDIGTAATENLVYTLFENVSSFKYRTKVIQDASSGATDRYFSMDMNSCITFNDPCANSEVLLTGHAQTVVSSSGVGSPNNMLGNPNSSAARFDNVNDVAVVKLEDLIPAGTRLYIRLSDFDGAGSSTVRVESSETNGSFTDPQSITFNGTAFRYVEYPITGGAQYLRLTNISGDFRIESISYVDTRCNAFPFAIDDQTVTDEDTPVTIPTGANDIPGDPGPHTVLITDAPNHGSVSIILGDPNNPTDDQIIYTPNANFFGIDTFVYDLCDLDGDCNSAVVIVTINSIDDVPVAMDDMSTTPEDTPISIDVTDNDDFGGDGPSTTDIILANGSNGLLQPSNGTISLVNGGDNDPTNDEVFYTPNTNYNGTDQFEYRICDVDGDCDVALVTVTITAVDDVPDAVDDGPITVAEDSQNNSVSVLVNDDFGGDGPSMTAITITTNPANGTATVDNGGTPNNPTDDKILYTPNPNYNGPDELKYQICDSDGDCDIATVTFNVTPVNDLPTAVDDATTTNEDTPVGYDVTNNDDFGGDGPAMAAITIITNGSNGNGVVDTKGTPTNPTDDEIIYTPNANFHGMDTVTYRICDSNGDCDDAILVITINSVDDTPDAVEDGPISVNEDSQNNPLLVLTNDDFGGDGPSMTPITITTNPLNGTATVDDGGTPNNPTDDKIIYTPNPNYNGLDELKYQICDSDGDCDIATVTINVNPVNDLPDAVDDGPIAVAEDSQNNSVSVLVNDDFGGDGPSMTPITITTNPLNGTATVDDGGTPNNPTDDKIIYTPNPNYNGPDELKYQICDSDGDCDIATVTFNVTPVNDLPIAMDDATTTDEDTPVGYDVTDNDDFGGDGPAMAAITIITNGSNGTGVVDTKGTPTNPTDDEIIYTPNANFHGMDTVTYRICDSNGDCDDAILVITINSVNDTPDAVNDGPLSVDEDSQNNPLLVLTNDDFGGDGPSMTPITITANPVNGTATVDDGSTPNDPTDDKIIYTPNADYNGPDSLKYQICDSDGECDIATVLINVNPVNDVPDAVDDGPITVAEDSQNNPVNVLVNDDFGGDGPSMSMITITTNPTNGIAFVNNGGSPADPTDDIIVYTPNANYNGPDQLNYQICDSDGDCDIATVTFNVTPVNDLPVAMDDATTTDEDTPVGYDVTDNDDFGGDGPAMAAITIVTNGSNGNGVVDTKGTPTNPMDDEIIYTPNANFHGMDTVTYRICDSNGDCDDAILVITINSVNDTPDAVNDGPLSVDEDSQNNPLLVLTNDDFGGDGPSMFPIIITTNPVNGTATVDDNNTPADPTDDKIIYTPNPNYNGPDSLKYQICDNDADCDIATVFINVNSINDLPDAVDDGPIVVDEDSQNNSVSVLVNDDFGGDGPSMSPITITTNPTNGTASVDDGGTPSNPTDDKIIYTPNANYNGPDELKYQICDSDGDCDIATVTFSVTPVNDLPLAVDDATTTDEDTPVGFDVTDNDNFGGDGPAMAAITIITNGSNGNGVVDTKGTPTDPTDDEIIYTPNANFHGMDTVTYRICDSNGDCDDAILVITINSVNDTPDAVNDGPLTVDEDSQNNPLLVLTNDDFGGDGPSMFPISITTNPVNGTATVDDGGTPSNPTDDKIIYTPNPNYHGPDSLKYQICDADGDCDIATVLINVNSVDDAPDAVNDGPIMVTEDSQNNPVNVLVNDDFGGDGPSMSPITITTNPVNGTATVDDNSTPSDPTDDKIIYTPNPNYHGPDSLKYQICDSDGDCDIATVTFDVASVNDLPLAVDDATTTDEDTPVGFDVTDNDNFGGDGPAMAAITIITNGSNGTGVVDTKGTPIDPTDDEIIYTPNANFHGMDTVTYRICDSDGDCDDAILVITINSVNDTPDAVNDGPLTVDEDSQNNPLLVLTNDDFGGDGPSMFPITITTNPVNGTATVDDGGTPSNPTDDKIIYTPNANYHGLDSLKYQICDADGDCDIATVLINVNSMNDVPVANDDLTITNEDVPVQFDVTFNDMFGGDGPSMTPITITIQPSNGMATVVDGGTPMDPTDDEILYTPNPNFNGSDTVTYQICDADGDCDPAILVIAILPVDDLPVAMDDASTTNEDTPVTIDVTDNDDFGGDGPSTTDIILPTGGNGLLQPSNGTITLVNGGDNDPTNDEIQYTPNLDYAGQDSFEYRICDIDNDCDIAKVIVTIVGLSDIGDAIFEDLNNNGVADLGEGVPNVTVLLMGLDVNNNPVNLTQMTDGNGKYLFTDILPGGYDVTVDQSTLPLPLQGGHVLVDPDGVLDGTSFVNVMANQDYLDQDFGFFAMSSIGDAAWFDLNRNGIRDNRFSPKGVNLGLEVLAPGIRVLLYKEDGTFIADKVTGPTGQYVFNGIVPGNYFIEFDTLTYPNPNFVITDFQVGADTNIDNDIRRGIYRSDTFAVNSGEMDNSRDIGMYRLPDPTITDPCVCQLEYLFFVDSLGYVYGERVEVLATPGGTWQVIPQDLATNMFTEGIYLDDNDGSVIPIDLNTQDYFMTEIAPGKYAFDFFHLGGQGYEIVVTDGIDTLDITNTCFNVPQDYDTELNAVCSYQEPLVLVHDFPTGTAEYFYLFDSAFVFQPGINEYVYVQDTVRITEFDPSLYEPGSTIAIYIRWTPTPGMGPAGSDCPKSLILNVELGLQSECLTTIGDFVWEDTSRDGIQDMGEPGLANVTINLLDENGLPVLKDGLGNDIMPFVTDMTGAYSFPNLIPNNYILEFVPQSASYGPTLSNQGTDDSKDSDIVGSNGRTAVFFAAQNVVSDSTDAGFVFVLPLAVDDATVTDEDTPVTFDVTDNDDFGADGPSSTPIEITEQPTSGMAVVFDGGTPTDPTDDEIIYTPNPNFNGMDTVTYRICDATGDCDTAILVITVNPVNDLPMAEDDVTVTDEDTPVTFDVTNNDDFGGDGPSATAITITGQPSNGTATVVEGTPNDPTDDEITYTPAMDFNGMDTVTYQICDANGDCDEAILVITINPTNDVPDAVNDDITIDLNEQVDIPVLVNDNFGGDGPSNTPIEVIGSMSAAGGSITVNTGGTLNNPTDDQVTYLPALNYSGLDSFRYFICDMNNDCDTATVVITINLNRVMMLPRVGLAGARYRTTDGLMRDDLRVGGHIPMTEPYTALPQFQHVGSGGGETITNPMVLGVSGPDAIVDWVFVELRDANDSLVIVETRSGLLQRDGDIVEVDGISNLLFIQSVPGSYYVSVRHRNHLGVMTASPVALTTAGVVVDFTLPAMVTYNNDPAYSGLSQKTQPDGSMTLWPGNSNSDDKVKYQAGNNDANQVLSDVLFHPANSSLVFNFNDGFGYYRGDVDMDGKVKYQGSLNDANYILNEVLFYPLNTGFTFNFDFMLEQLPK